MPITLTSEQERKLTAKAERAHKSMDAVLDEFLEQGSISATHLPEENHETPWLTQHPLPEKTPTGEPIRPENLALLALLQKWSEEDEQMTDEEAEQALRDYEELRENLNLNRIRAGEVPLYP